MILSSNCICVLVVERSQMGEKRNHSDVPAGDIDPNRQAFRGGMTSYNWDMKAVSMAMMYPKYHNKNLQFCKALQICDIHLHLF